METTGETTKERYKSILSPHRSPAKGSWWVLPKVTYLLHLSLKIFFMTSVKCFWFATCGREIFMKLQLSIVNYKCSGATTKDRLHPSIPIDEVTLCLFCRMPLEKSSSFTPLPLSSWFLLVESFVLHEQCAAPSTISYLARNGSLRASQRSLPLHYHSLLVPSFVTRNLSIATSQSTRRMHSKYIQGRGLDSRHISESVSPSLGLP